MVNDIFKGITKSQLESYLEIQDIIHDNIKVNDSSFNLYDLLSIITPVILLICVMLIMYSIYIKKLDSII